MSFFLWLERLNLLMMLSNERSWARWLPWWRRYASVLPQSLLVAMRLRDPKASQATMWLALAGCALVFWNGWTANKNRRNKRDFKKLEAESCLTEVQQTAFRREAAEASA